MNKICVKGQSLYFYRPPEPIPKSQVNFSKIEFDMDETWSGFLSVVAQFIQNGKPKNVKVEDGYCFVPSELGIGAFELCLRGDDGESVVASVNRLTLEVCEGFDPSGETPLPPSPDLYTQLVKEIDSGKKIAQSVREDADSGKFNGPPGKSPKIIDGNWFVWDFEAGAYVDTGVAASGGGGGGAVSSVNGQTGTVELTANDVGAISQDDLQAATNKALAQAKASGEFDGPQGPEGPKGPAGPAGAGMDITGATVGQIVKIKAVDENGKPTEWEAADMASGGGEKPWRYDKLIEFSEDTAGFTLDTFDDGSPFDFTEVEITAALKNAATSSVWGDVAAVSDGFIDGKYMLVGGSNSFVSKMTNSGQWYLYYLHGVVDAVKKSVSATVAPNTSVMYINAPAVFYGNEIYQMPNFAYSTTAIQGKWETPPTKFTTVKSGMKIGAGSSIHIRGR